MSAKRDIRQLRRDLAAMGEAVGLPTIPDGPIRLPGELDVLRWRTRLVEALIRRGDKPCGCGRSAAFPAADRDRATVSKGELMAAIQWLKGMALSGPSPEARGHAGAILLELELLLDTKLVD